MELLVKIKYLWSYGAPGGWGWGGGAGTGGIEEENKREG